MNATEHALHDLAHLAVAPRNGMTIPYTLHLGDCLESLKKLPDNSVDSIVTDPPYGLSKEPDMAEVLRHWLAGDDYHHKGGGFMGKTWDSFVPGPAIWRECHRVLKPGGHLLSFFGSRTYDMGTLAIRLAGFEVRDQIMWVYGSGFPKSLDVSKAIDKAAGAQREVIGVAADFARDGADRKTDGSHIDPHGNQGGHGYGDRWSAPVTAPATEAARQWQGWGTALKPAHEPICVARKPLEGTVAANVLQHGTGALNIDVCRVPTEGEKNPSIARRQGSVNHLSTRSAAEAEAEGKIESRQSPEAFRAERAGEALGRWPANLIHDGSEEVLEAFPQASGAVAPVKGTEASAKTANAFGDYSGRAPSDQRDGGGSAARFFYCAKASKADREEGLAEMPDRILAMSNQAKAEQARGNMHEGNSGMNTAKMRKNNHPTVKPTDLMAYLCRLVTPPGGLVLDPFMGSGSTGKACMREGFRFIGIDLTPEYVAIARARIEHELAKQSEPLAEISPQIELFQSADRNHPQHLQQPYQGD